MLEAIDLYSRDDDSRNVLRRQLEQYDRAVERKIERLRDDLLLYRTMSTAGITAATFAHESRGNPTKVIVQAINSIEYRVRKKVGHDYTSVLGPQFQSIRSAVSRLSVLGTATLSLIENDKRRIGNINVCDTVESTIALFKPFIDNRNINVDYDCVCPGLSITGTVASMESIVANFLNNSFVALEDVSKKSRKIQVEITSLGNKCLIHFSDNGSGIVGISVKDIWLPGQSTRPGGTGLGLTIIRDTVRDLGGEVWAKEQGELGGASFHVSIPLGGSNSASGNS